MSAVTTSVFYKVLKDEMMPWSSGWWTGVQFGGKKNRDLPSRVNNGRVVTSTVVHQQCNFVRCSLSNARQEDIKKRRSDKQSDPSKLAFVECMDTVDARHGSNGPTNQQKRNLRRSGCIYAQDESQTILSGKWFGTSNIAPVLIWSKICSVWQSTEIQPSLIHVIDVFWVIRFQLLPQLFHFWLNFVLLDVSCFTM